MSRRRLPSLAKAFGGPPSQRPDVETNAQTLRGRAPGRRKQGAVQFSVLLPADMKRAIKARAAAEGTDVSAVAERVWRDWLEQPSQTSN
jgi:hypothetical protein